jgi:hypothetical protein
VPRCKVYEVQGPDPSRTAGARRCVREATERAVVASRDVAVCERHDSPPWKLFEGKDGWVYAVNRNADTPAEKKKTKKTKKRTVSDQK